MKRERAGKGYAMECYMQQLKLSQARCQGNFLDVSDVAQSVALEIRAETWVL
jgi:hypothetical protein